MAFYFGKEAKVDKLLRESRRERKKRGKKVSFLRRCVMLAMAFLRLFALLAALCLVGFLGRAFYFFLMESNFFRITYVEIEGVKKETSKEVAAVLNIDKLVGSNYFSVSVNGLTEKLATHMPKLADIRISKVPPRQIVVYARERKPIVYIGAKDLFLMDRQSVVIEKISRTRDDLPDLPFITGVNPSAVELGKPVEDRLVLAALETLVVLKRANEKVYLEVSEVNVDKQEGLTLVLLNGTKMKFKPENLRSQLASLDMFLKEFKNTATFEYVDFRFKDQIVYMPRQQPVAAQ